MLPKIHLSVERWRKNTEYGVWVSNQGRVRLLKNKKLLEPRIDKAGYCLVFTDMGAIRVHRLVAYTWLGDRRNEKYTVDHINSNKRDNSIKNLRNQLKDSCKKSVIVFVDLCKSTDLKQDKEMY